MSCWFLLHNTHICSHAHSQSLFEVLNNNLYSNLPSNKHLPTGEEKRKEWKGKKKELHNLEGYICKRWLNLLFKINTLRLCWTLCNCLLQIATIPLVFFYFFLNSNNVLFHFSGWEWSWLLNSHWKVIQYHNSTSSSKEIYTESFTCGSKEHYTLRNYNQYGSTGFDRVVK